MAFVPVNMQASMSDKKTTIQISSNIQSGKSKSKNGFKFVDLEDQFKAACDAIQNLPKNGPFQPSNEMLLRFYGFFKQATEGECKKTRPSMFNVVERAKWDAWNSVKHLNKIDAMQGYIDQIRTIIETMPHDKFVQKLTEILEPIDPLYEYPVDSTNAESLDNIEESTDQILNSVNGSNTEINTGNHQEFPDLKLPTFRNGTSWNEWATENKPTNSFRQSDIFMSLNNIAELSSNSRMKINHRDSAADSSPSSGEKNTESLASDDEEDYCDTSDHLINENIFIQKVKNALRRESVDLIQGKKAETVKDIPDCQSRSKSLASLIHKYGGDLNNPSTVNGSINNYELIAGNGQPHQSRPGSSLSMGYTNRSGGGGGSGRYPPNEGYNTNVNQDTNRQILLLLMRLQQDTNNVITRLSYLEATVLSLQSNLQMNRIENSIKMSNENRKKTGFEFSQIDARSSTDSNLFGYLFSFLKSVDWKTVAIAIVWPLIIRLAVYIAKKINFVLKLKGTNR